MAIGLEDCKKFFDTNQLNCLFCSFALNAVAKFSTSDLSYGNIKQCLNHKNILLFVDYDNKCLYYDINYDNNIIFYDIFPFSGRASLYRKIHGEDEIKFSPIILFDPDIIYKKLSILLNFK